MFLAKQKRIFFSLGICVTKENCFQKEILLQVREFYKKKNRKKGILTLACSTNLQIHKILFYLFIDYIYLCTYSGAGKKLAQAVLCS